MVRNKSPRFVLDLARFLAGLHNSLQFTQMSKAARDKSKGKLPTASEDQSAAARRPLHMSVAGAMDSTSAVGSSNRWGCVEIMHINREEHGEDDWEDICKILRSKFLSTLDFPV